MTTTRKLSGILTVALVISLVIALASCTLLGGSLALKSFTVDRSTVKTVYIVGEEIDFSGIKATATYSDETLNKVYTFDELTITYDDDITATPGQKTVKVSFMDPNLNVLQETTVQITVNEDPFAVKHASYRIDSTAVKTSYNLGETVDFAGIKLYEKFTDGSEVELTDLTKLTYSPALDTLTETAGNKIVKVQYNGEDAGAVTVSVIDPEEEKNHVVSVVIGGEYKTGYETGEELDLTGLTVTVTYEDGEVEVLTHESITAEDVDMSSAGTTTVIISFLDPINNEENFESITVTVVKKDVVAQFEKPATIIAFESANKNAGSLNYGDTGFQGQYINGDKIYKIGDDNAFSFVPGFAIEDENGIPKTLAAFYTDIDIYMLVEGEYVLLEKTADASNPALFTYVDSEGNVVASVDTYRGSYQFGEAAVGAQIKISVLPSEDYYKLDNVNAVTLEAQIIDAYNVSAAWQLAVIDNYADRTDWEAFKNEKGLTGIAPAGIVIHNDIHISASDVPASFFNVSEKEITYYKVVNGVVEQTSVAPVGTKYLIDGTDIYRRTSTSDFVIEGNFFAIDTRNFPLIASPAVFDANLDLDYGDDYSNATLFMFEAISSNWTPVAVPEISIENITFIGNASRDNWVDGETDGNLVTAGGLILLKSARYASTAMTNTVNNSFFIAYFPDYSGTLSVKDSKCYDSYQNSAFVWADSTLSVENSYINGSGGPVIISQSVKENVNGTESYYSPVTTVNGSVIETHVTGGEVWFKAVGATGIVGNINALGGGLDQLVSTVTGAMGNTVNATWVDSQGKMNIKAIIMPRGSSTDALIDGMIQGTATFDGIGVERWYEPTENFEAEWAAILQNPYFQAGAPFLTAVGPDGTAHTIYFVQQGVSGTFYDMNGLAIGTESPDTAAIITAFATAEQVVLHQGGLSAVLELYH